MHRTDVDLVLWEQNLHKLWQTGLVVVNGPGTQDGAGVRICGGEIVTLGQEKDSISLGCPRTVQVALARGIKEVSRGSELQIPQGIYSRTHKTAPTAVGREVLNDVKVGEKGGVDTVPLQHNMAVATAVKQRRRSIAVCRSRKQSDREGEAT